MDLLHGLLKWVDYNRGLVVALILALAVTVGLASCQVKTGSILEPGTQITIPELQREAVIIRAEVDSKLKLLRAAQEDVERQVAFRQEIVGIVGSLGTAAAGGQLTSTTGVAAIIQLVTLFGLGGALYDNKRKDKILAAKV